MGLAYNKPLGIQGEVAAALTWVRELDGGGCGLLPCNGDSQAGTELYWKILLTPDLWITFFGLTEQKLSTEGTSKKLGSKVTWVGAPGAHSSRTVMHGTLIIEIYDGRSGDRIWSGWATSESANRKKLLSRAAKATRKIISELPQE